MFDIEEELKKLPAKPGVYIMHDRHDAIIYVGKAISLKNRVRQYFQSSRGKSAKIQQMVSLIDYFEYIVVNSEMEALVLENNLIKEHHPKYNTLLKDDKTYPYICVTTNEPYPRMVVTRKQKKDKATYFGPYSSPKAVWDIVELLRRLYHVRTCSVTLPQQIGNLRPCMYHEIGQCDAPCTNRISQAAYMEQINGVVEFLGGNHTAILRQLETKMKDAAQALQFEEAGTYRDLIGSIRTLEQRQQATVTDFGERDIIAYATAEDEAVVQVFFIREGKILGREHYHLTGVREETGAHILCDFIKQYYAGTPFVPKELLLQTEPEEMELLGQWLSEVRGSKVRIIVPKIGSKERLIELAQKNAATVLTKDSERISREEAKTIGAMAELAELLSLPQLYRVESYDISNTSGFDSVASMVVFENGKAKRNDYRKFRIKTVSGPDDYASMYEVLTRRFLHGLAEKQEQTAGKNSFSQFPDIIFMDGGKGQVNVALQVMEELKLQIPVCGMVKDDHHRTRGLFYQNQEIPINTSGEGFHLLTRIQDETHRFAIEYHRLLRGKTQVHSVLDDIPGIGPARRRMLMKHMESLEAVKAASVEELAALPSFNLAAAEAVYKYFRENG